MYSQGWLWYLNMGRKDQRFEYNLPLNLRQRGPAGLQRAPPSDGAVGEKKKYRKTSERSCDFQALLEADLGVLVEKAPGSG